MDTHDSDFEYNHSNERSTNFVIGRIGLALASIGGTLYMLWRIFS